MFYRYEFESCDYDSRGDFAKYEFKKDLHTFNLKSFKEVKEKTKNFMIETSMDNIFIDGIITGAIWNEENRFYSGIVYMDEKYEPFLLGNFTDFKAVEKKIKDNSNGSIQTYTKHEFKKIENTDSYSKLLNDIITELNNNYPDEVLQIRATDAQLQEAESRLSLNLPESYKKFLVSISNGIELFITEHIASTEELLKTNDVSKTHFNNLSAVKIKDRGLIDASRLVSFTLWEYVNSSTNHWVFICDKEYSDNEYPVGYICEDTGNIIQVLDGGFKEWLETFWKGYKFGEYKTVFSLLHPEWEEMENLWDLDW